MARHIYVHIPFCEAKCPYCSFFSVTYPCVGYVCAILSEIEFIEREADAGRLPDNNPSSDTVNTIYFGGGTPSVMHENDICEVLACLIKVFDIKDSDEKTIEVNPHSLTADKARAYFKAGFNRISIGIQSLAPDVLKTLGRLHNREQALEAVDIAREAGFTNISADLMIGVPGQSMDQLIESAVVLLAKDVKHISMYSLSVEEGTIYEKMYGGRLDEYVAQEEERAMYHGLREYLKDRGVIPYEISNCAYEGSRSLHNGAYWKGLEYFGIGAGAHGFINGRRYCHTDSVEDYIRSPQTTITEEILTDEDKMREYAMLMLRTTDGIDHKEFFERFGKNVNDIYAREIEDNLNKGLIVKDRRGIRLSDKGLDFGNIVFADFL